MISIKGSVLRSRLALVEELAPRVVEEECRARGGSVCRYRVSWS